MFEPFFSTKGNKRTGLGLSTCKIIVENHGGQIDIQSELGKGTVVKITLPCVEKASHR